MYQTHATCNRPRPTFLRSGNILPDQYTDAQRHEAYEFVCNQTNARAPTGNCDSSRRSQHRACPSRMDAPTARSMYSGVSDQRSANWSDRYTRNVEIQDHQKVLDPQIPCRLRAASPAARRKVHSFRESSTRRVEDAGSWDRPAILEKQPHLARQQPVQGRPNNDAEQIHCPATNLRAEISADSCRGCPPQSAVASGRLAGVSVPAAFGVVFRAARFSTDNSSR
jgi:hypothetical protein